MTTNQSMLTTKHNNIDHCQISIITLYNLCESVQSIFSISVNFKREAILAQ